MQRNPSIHITLSDFIKLLEKMGVLRPAEFAADVLEAAQPYQIRNRQFVTTKTAQKKKIEKTQAQTGEQVELFQRCLAQVRQALGHKLIKVIKPGESDYALLKEVTDLAKQFCTAYERQTMEGFQIFVRIGIELMGKNYGLNKFKYHFEKIGTAYESLLAIEEDPDKKSTDVMQAAYVKQCGRIGYTPEITGEDRLHFLYARLEADTVKATYNDWMKAQFEGLEWTGNIPELTQLYTKGALKRYQDWRKKNSLKIAEVVEEGQTDEMTEYFRILAAKRVKGHEDE